MATTQLSPSALPGIPYSFIAKEPAPVSGRAWTDMLLRGQDGVTGKYLFIDGSITMDPGASMQRVVADSSPYTALARDFVILCDTDTGAIEIDLPAGIRGKNYKIVNCGSSGADVTVDPNGSEQIYGEGAGVAVTLVDGEIINIHFEETEGWW